MNAQNFPQHLVNHESFEATNIGCLRYMLHYEKDWVFR